VTAEMWIRPGFGGRRLENEGIEQMHVSLIILARNAFKGCRNPVRLVILLDQEALRGDL